MQEPFGFCGQCISTRSASGDDARCRVHDARCRVHHTARDRVYDEGEGWSIPLQVACDALFHLQRKRRHRPGDLVAVHPQHQLLKHRQRHPPPGFLPAE